MLSTGQIRHGGKVKLCSSEGCTNHSKKGGVCMRHGAKFKQCVTEGCTNGAINGGVCVIDMGQKSNAAEAKDVEAMLKREECAVGMGQITARTMNLLHLNQNSNRPLQINPNPMGTLLDLLSQDKAWRKESPERWLFSVKKFLRSDVSPRLTMTMPHAGQKVKVISLATTTEEKHRKTTMALLGLGQCRQSTATANLKEEAIG